MPVLSDDALDAIAGGEVISEVKRRRRQAFEISALARLSALRILAQKPVL
jgi:hypothetical protein